MMENFRFVVRLYMLKFFLGIRSYEAHISSYNLPKTQAQIM